MTDIRKTGALNFKELQAENAVKNSNNYLPFDSYLPTDIEEYSDDPQKYLSNKLKSDTQSYANESVLEATERARRQTEALQAAIERTGYGESRYDKSLYSLGQLDNLEEERSLRQSGFNQIINGVGKMAVLTGTTFADNFIGSLAGAINVINEAKEGNIHSGKDALNAFVENPFSLLMQHINDWSEGFMPNYYTNEEKNSPWYTQLWKANFIGDKFLKNVGFFAGAAASGLVSSFGWSKLLGVSKARDIFRGAAIAANAPEGITEKAILQAMKTGDMATSTQMISDALLESAKSLHNKNIVVKLLSGISGSFGESRIEAITNSADKYDNQINQLNAETKYSIDSILDIISQENPGMFTYEHVFDKEGRYLGKQLKIKDGSTEDVQQLYNEKFDAINKKYQERVAEITREKINYSNTSFLMNLLVTSADNMLVFGDAFAGGYSMRRAYKDLVKKVPQEALKEGEKVLYEANKALARKTLAKGLVSPIAEGTQEMLQQTITEGLNRWEGGKYNTFYGEGVDEEGLKAQTGWLDNMLKTLGDVYTDIDQWENFYLGFVTGAIPIPSKVKKADRTTGEVKTKIGIGGELYESIREYRDIKKQSKELAGQLNGAYKALDDAANDKERMAFLSDKIRREKLDAAQDEALQDGNTWAFKNIEFDKLMSHAIAFAEAGRMDDFINLVEAYYTVKPEDIEQIRQFGVVKGTKKSIFDGKGDDEILSYFDKQKERAIADAKKFQEVYTNIVSLYGDDVAGYAQDLTYLTMSIDNRERRIKEISDKLINYINENVESIAANNPDFAERIANGQSPLQSLQSIKDLAVAFDNDDIAELQSLIYKRDVSLQKLADRIKLKSARRWGSAGFNQRRINVLEKKQESEGLTKEESKELARRKKIVEKKTKDADSIYEGLKAVKEALNKSKEVDLQQQTEDLAKLLIEREAVLNTFAALAGNKEAFSESLARQILTSLYADSDRKITSAYEKFAQTRKLSDIPKQAVFSINSEGEYSFKPLSLEHMAGKAEEEGNKQLLDYIEKLLEYQSYFDGAKDHEEFDVSRSRKAANLFNDISNVLRRAYGKDYGIAIDEFLDSPETIRIYGEDFIKNFKKYRSETVSAQAATSSKATAEKVDETPVQESDRLKKLNAVKNDKDLPSKSRAELEKLAGELGIEGDIVDAANSLFPESEFTTLSDIDDDNFFDVFEQGIQEAINKEEENPTQNASQQSQAQSSKIQEAPQETDNDEDSTPVEEPVEEEPEKDGDEVNIANRRKSVIAPTKIKARVSSTESTDEDMTGETKIGVAKNSIGNSERRLLPAEAQVSKETFAVNKHHAKYQYSPLKDPKQRIAKPYTDSVLRSVLDYYKVQEFIDSGDLAKLKEKAEANGHPLKVHFVVLYNHTKEKGFNSYVKNQRPIFIAVEATSKSAPHGNVVEFYTATGKKKMQVIGVVSEPNAETNPEENAQYQLLQEEVYARHGKAYQGEGKSHHYRFDTGIVTNLSWIYSGRVAKAVEDANGDLNKQPNDQIDVSDLLTTDQLNKPDGHLQITIKTRFKEYDYGEALGGEEIRLNPNRPASGYTGAPASRTATIWIKTREADGRVYYKGARIKDFNSDYKEDNSPIAERIKKAIRHIIESGTDISGIHKGYDELLKYLYLSGKKTLFVNTKNGTITVRGSSVQAMPIEYESEEQLDNIVDLVYNGLKELGDTKSGSVRFSLGLDGSLSLKDILESKVVTTDLGSLHNVNASVLIDKVDVDTSTEAGNRKVTAVPSETIREWEETRRIHTGIEGIQESRSYTVAVSLDGGNTNYRKWASDNKWHDDTTNEPVTDDFLSWQLDFYLDMKLGYIEPSQLFFGKKTNKIYIKEYDGQDVYMDSNGHILTEDEKIKLGNLMRGHQEEAPKSEIPKQEETSKEEKKSEESKEEKPAEEPKKKKSSILDEEFGSNDVSSTSENQDSDDGLTDDQREGWDAIESLKEFFKNKLKGFYNKSFMKTLTKKSVNKYDLQWAASTLSKYTSKIGNDEGSLINDAEAIDSELQDRNQCGWK